MYIKNRLKFDEFTVTYDNWHIFVDYSAYDVMYRSRFPVSDSIVCFIDSQELAIV